MIQPETALLFFRSMTLHALLVEQLADALVEEPACIGVRNGCGESRKGNEKPGEQRQQREGAGPLRKSASQQSAHGWTSIETVQFTEC
jgi:hypothetical protein